jgi:transglutaminase-like putative cysteine protease
MRYQVHHTTQYRYHEPVTLCHNEAHLLPRSLSRQRCVDARIWVEPKPATYHERKDIFGNRVVYFSIEEPHTTLTVNALSEVQLSSLSFPNLATTPAWEEVQMLLRRNTDRGALEARQFVLESPFVNVNPIFSAYAKQAFWPGRPLLLATYDLMRHIFTEFAYDPEFTTIATPLLEVFEHKRGVCQDFAHLTIACLRSLGLSARYVSGYLETRPPPGQSQLLGSTASHAWVSVYCPELGWIDFDPTNNLMPSDRHIVVAWGRDYSDVTPLKGTVIGGGPHELQVGVEMQQVEE